MSFSLNEIEAMAKRAARGAGYDWGLAEEAAKAARWLCAQGCDGAGALARLLAAGLAADAAAHRPAALDGRDWRGTGALCPLASGAALADAAALGAGELVLHDVAEPLVLLPFAALCAQRIGAPVLVRCGDGEAVCADAGLSLGGTWPARAGRVVLSAGGAPGTPRPEQTRASPEPADWAALGAFAQRSFAPATEESRLLGAGAGLSDND